MANFSTEMLQEIEKDMEEYQRRLMFGEPQRKAEAWFKEQQIERLERKWPRG